VDFNPFDVTSKELVWEDPSGWLQGFGVEPTGPVDVIDSDINTLSAAADKVIRVAVSEPELAVVIGRIKARVDPESPPLAAKLWTATYLLMGLRYNDELVAILLEGVQMTQSTTYQRILKEGRLREARQFLRRLGTRRFGEPDPSSAAALEGIQDVNHLEALGERALLPEVKGWQDLLEGA
jgi:hypothetical protein